MEKSLARSKKTTLTFASELAKEGCSALVPGGGLMYEGVKALVQHGIKFYEDRKTERIERFHEVLLGEHATNREEVLHKEFAIEDYTILLSHAVQDEEDDKVDIYSRIFKALQNNQISKEFKSHILKSSRDLLVSEFELMKEIFISSTFEFKDEGNIREQITRRTRTANPIINLSIQNLIRLGYLYDKDGTKPPYPTDLLKELVSSIYSKEELRPEVINKEIWKDIQVFIACFNLDKHAQILSKISNAFSKQNIKTVIAVPSRQSIAQAASTLIVLCNDNEVYKDVETYKKQNHQYCDKTIEVYLSGTINNFMGEITDKTFSFESDDDQQVQLFIKFVADKLAIKITL